MSSLWYAIALMVDVATNLRQIMDRIAAAAARSGRATNEIRLLAASKSQPVNAIGAAIAAGVAMIGENYVQEAAQKKEHLSNAAVEWHMIGHLQRNKVKLALRLFDVIESLDNLALARELDKEAAKLNKCARVFVEVNLGGEGSKTGVDKALLPSLLEGIGSLTHIHVDGLMTVPPFCENFEAARPYFRELRELALKLGAMHLPNINLKELSMGMSQDFPVAIEEGATIVRIGTALFGPRV